LTQKVAPGARDLRIELPHSPHAPAIARAAIDDLSLHLDEDRHEDLKLLVSEVVTNSVRHSPEVKGGRIQLDLISKSGSVRAEICDSGSGFTFVPKPRRFSIDQVSGWGLDIVGQLSDSWGITTKDGGVCVWFEIRNRPGR